MSKFTTEVRYICEVAAGLEHSKGLDDIDAIIDASQDAIFGTDNPYPIFNESYRQVLQHKILAHYYTREISEETVGLWKFRLRTKMKEIMPYYNQLYLSELLEFNPLDDTKFTISKNEQKNGETNEDITRKGNVSGEKQSSVSENTDRSNTRTKDDMYSDTPQNGLSSVRNGNYLTTADIINELEDGNENRNGASNEATFTDKTDTENGTKVEVHDNKSIEEYIGKMSKDSFAKLLKEYRDTFLNIDMMIIEELKNLFFMLYE